MRFKKPRRTPEQKRVIYDLYLNSELTLNEISKQYKISTSTVYKIVREIENER
ncbi:sigma factor-like helix-turn-helix DNA-binding protein [Vibrio splendidus]|uniref:sigma factor-like helix-turn-helix DNA-binding protein n=1 Tax=Vibrio splendidus TaxID=29497 RepID=UPI003CE5311D